MERIYDSSDDIRLSNWTDKPIDPQDSYVDPDSHLIATYKVEGEWPRHSIPTTAGGSAPTGCLKPFLIGFGVLAVIGVLFLFICGILMPVILGLIELFN